MIQIRNQGSVKRESWIQDLRAQIRSGVGAPWSVDLGSGGSRCVPFRFKLDLI
jgi:hypothetical protein